jgi:hypothetical protein
MKNEMIRRLNRKVWTVLILLLTVAVPVLNAEPAPQETIKRGTVTVRGLSLSVEPENQTVPINTPTVVNTHLNVENTETLQGMMVKGNLKGPGLTGTVTLTTYPNHPFSIPGFTAKGIYTLEDIHLEKDGIVLLSSKPATVTIQVMDIVVTRIETRPLTLEEIREKGINITDKNFTVYNFSVGIMVESQEVRYEFPVVYNGPKPYIPPQGNVSDGMPVIGGGGGGETVPFTLELPDLELPNMEFGPKELSKKIPGILIFNNNIAFLNQFFSVMFIVSNNAPDGSPIALKDLTAKLSFNSEGLREAETTPPHIPGTPIPVRCPGPDGKIGTADDLDIILATFNGMAEFLAEGIDEGTHVVTVDFEGTMTGLSVGDIPVKGSANGAVIVRNPEFSITFSHPEVVRDQEEYDLYITITNTSPVAGNLVSLQMPSEQIVGASLLSVSPMDGTTPDDKSDIVRFETIASGQSETAHFRMRSNRTGKVRATAMEMGENLKGSFLLTVGVGEEGIPLSPDTLVLPSYAYELPNEIINPAMLALGEAYSIAVTPPGGLPEGLPIISAQAVKNRVQELTEAGQRLLYCDKEFDTLAVYSLDRLGNRTPDMPYDILRRLTSKGINEAEALALEFNKKLNELSNPQQFLETFAQTAGYKNPYIAATLTSGNEPAAKIQMIDYYGNRLIPSKTVDEFIRNIPYAEYMQLTDDNLGPVDTLWVGQPDENGYTVEVFGTKQGTFNLSIQYPAAGKIRQVDFANISCQIGSRSYATFKPGDQSITLHTDMNADGTDDSTNTVDSRQILLSPLKVVGAVQDCNVDEAGHVVALLFNRTITKETAQDALNYKIEGKKVYASFLQPSQRVVLVGLDNPISPFVPSEIKVENITATDGAQLTSQTVPIVATIDTPGGIVYGKILNADGSTVANAKIQLLEYEKGQANAWGDPIETYSHIYSDASGNYRFDYVRILSDPFEITVLNPANGKIEKMSSRLHTHGQRLQMDIIMRGRGTVTGILRDENNTPLPGAAVWARAENGTPYESYTAVSDADGKFVLNDLPLGNIAVTAQHNAIRGNASAALQSPGQIIDIAITLVAGKTGTVAGRVTQSDAVTPVPDADVLLSQEGLYLGRTKSDDNGYFKFAYVPVGSYHLQAFNPATYRYSRSVTGQLNEGQTTNVTVLFSGAGTVTGNVYNHSGTPLQGIQVFIPNTAFKSETDEAGYFEINTVPVGTHTLMAYNPVTKENISAAAKIQAEGASITVNLVYPDNTPGSIEGYVRNENGQLISGVDVYLSNYHYNIIAAVKTDSEGKYDFDGIPPESYKIIVLKDGKAGIGVTSLKKSNEIVNCNVQIRGKGKLKVAVKNSEGTAGIIADVTITSPVFEFAPGSFIGFRAKQIEITTADNGTCELNDVFTGQYTVAAKNDFYPQGVRKTGVLLNDGQVETIELRMDETNTIAVTVIDHKGDPVAETARLVLQYGGNTIGNFNEPNSPTTDSKGQKVFTLIPQGSFHLQAKNMTTNHVGQHNGYIGYNGQTVNVELRLKGLGTVRGLVRGAVEDETSEALPVPGAEVTLRNIDYPYGVQTAVTAIADDGQTKKGTFEITGVPEGRFEISVVDVNGSQLTGRTEGTVASHGDVVDVVVRLEDSATVKGFVYKPDGATQTAVANARVILYDNNRGVAVAYYTSDSQGAFQFDYVKLGSYRLEVFDPATGRKGKEYLTVASTSAVEKNVILEGKGTVTGTFYDGSMSNPIPNARVKLSSKGVFQFDTTTNTDSQGNFKFELISQGPFALEAVDPATQLVGKAEGQVETDLQVVTLDIIAQASGTVTGTVYKSDNTIDIESPPSVKLEAGGRTDTITTQDDGTFVFNTVPAGTFKLVAKQNGGPGYGTAQGKLLYHDQVVNLNVIFRDTGKLKIYVRDAGGNPVLQTGRINIKLYTAEKTYDNLTYNETEGCFPVDALPLGNFRVEARDIFDKRSASATGTIETNGQEIPVILTLTPAGSVGGTVLKFDGFTPAAGAIATLKGIDFIYNQTANDQGSFFFSSVPLGSFSVYVRGADGVGSAMFSGELTADGQLIEPTQSLTLDNTIPQVESFLPTPGSAQVPITTPLTVTFTEAMNPGTFNPGITLKNLTDNAVVSASVTLSPDGLTATIAPNTTQLSGDKVYAIIVDPGVEDVDGNSIGTQVTASFTTLDNTGPVVQTVTPANNAVGVDPGAPIEILFSEPVVTAAFTYGAGKNMTVERSGVQGVVDGTIAFNPTGTVLTFTPAPDSIVANAQYVVTITGQKDNLGNIQAATATSQFFTQDTTAPDIDNLTLLTATPIIEGSNVNVRADFSTNAADVKYVDFFVDGVFKIKVMKPQGYTYVGTAIALPMLKQLPTGVNSVSIQAQAVDEALNRGNIKDLEVTLNTDQPPVVTLTSLTGSTILPGKKIQVNADAKDDRRLMNITCNVSYVENGVIVPKENNFQELNQKEINRNYDFNVPVDTKPGTEIRVDFKAEDNRGIVVKAPTLVITVPQDEIDPVVVINSPVADKTFEYNENIKIQATVTDDIGIDRVEFYMDSIEPLKTLEPPVDNDLYEYTIIHTKALQDPTNFKIKVIAYDLAGNSTEAEVNVTLNPASDPNAPIVKFTTPTTGTLVYPGETVYIKVDAQVGATTNAITEVSFIANGDPLPPDTTSPYEAIYTVPDVAEGTPIKLEAVAVDAGSNTGNAVSNLTVVRGTTFPDGTVISDATYDNETIIINTGTVTINGSHTFKNILVKGDGILTHTVSNVSNPSEKFLGHMDLTTTGKIVVGPDALIDADGKGYPGANKEDNNTTYGLTTGFSQGSNQYGGGSYGGLGGTNGSNGEVNLQYGNHFTPDEPGSGGGGNEFYPGGNGGGFIKLVAQDIILDGEIRTNGESAPTDTNKKDLNGGSGGGIHLNTGILAGSGIIAANGGNSRNVGTGGGGRIAVYYTDLTGFNENNIQCFGGLSNNNVAKINYNGTPGTIYLKPANKSGRLIVFGIENHITNATPLPTVKPGTITAVNGHTMTDENTQFIPGKLTGMLLIAEIQNPMTFVVVGNTEDTISVDPNGPALEGVAPVGTSYRLKYAGTLKLEYSKLHISGDNEFDSIDAFKSEIVVDGTLRVDKLELNETSTLTHSEATINKTNKLHIIAREMSVDINSKVDVTAKGYLGGGRYSTSPTVTDNSLGRTLNNAKGSDKQSAGSYGGFGGMISTYNVNPIYGSIYEPSDPGSGGGWGGDTNAPGGNGGGVIRLEISETLVLDGTIASNGGDIITNNRKGAGGSGGSIYIKTGTLNGTGSVTATGGISNYDGGGGGGRIAIYYDIANSFNFSAITAKGGHALNENQSNSFEKLQGSAGTVFLEQTDQNGRLIIDNRNANSVDARRPEIFPVILPTTITDISFVDGKTIITGQNADYVPGSLVGMKLIPNILKPGDGVSKIVANDNTKITVLGDVTGIAGIGDTYKGVMVLDGDLIVRGTNIILNRDIEMKEKNLHLTEGSTVTIPTATQTSLHYLAIDAANVTIDAGSAIDVSEKGYLGACQEGGIKSYGFTIGNVPCGVERSGGSHGGYGGQSADTVACMVYGSIYKPFDAGSGGTSGTPSISECTIEDPGGNGGGVVRIIATGTFILNGNIMANGGSCRSVQIEYSYAAGGAGGSIHIGCSQLIGSGEIKAIGGSAYNRHGGSGGRIAVYHGGTSTFNFDTNIKAYGGKRMKDDLKPQTNGGAGTIYIKEEHSLGDLIIDNNDIITAPDPNFDSVTTRFPSVAPINGASITYTVKENKIIAPAGTFIPNALVGMKVNPFPAFEQSYTIIANTDSEITTLADDGAMTQTEATVSVIIGEHDLRNLIIRKKATVETADRVHANGTITVEPGSSFKAENHQ